MLEFTFELNGKELSALKYGASSFPAFSGKDQWFALYAADSKMDDETICINITRGQFRLHPKGRAGISKGCIVVENKKDFATIRALLKNTSTIKIPGLELETYGRVIVK